MHASQKILQHMQRTLHRVRLNSHAKCLIQMPNFSTEASAPPYLDPPYKGFSQVPGPRRLPLVGNLHLFSMFGPYTFQRLYDAFTEMHEQYGPIVRLDLGIKMLLLFDPEDILHMYNLGERYPARPLFEALRYYRLKERKDVYGSAGLIAENGEEWDRLRHAVNFMMVPGFVKSYFSTQEEVADDFVSRMLISRDENGVIENFLDELYRYTEEAIGVICFGTRLGLLKPSSSNSEFSSKLSQASDETMQALVDTLIGFPWWKFFNTPTYKKLVRSQDFFHRFSKKCIEEAELKLKDPRHKDDVKLEFFKKLFLNKNLRTSDINLIMTEIFSAGIDATGNTIGFFLYNLAKNPEVQEKLYQNIQQHTMNGLDKDSYAKMDYFKACIHESYRLTPTTGGNARILSSKTVFSGYTIPEKVLCFAMHPVISRSAKHFEDPLEFRPERWLEEGRSTIVHKSHPYCVAPFSHGVRRCVGQRFAEQEIRLCIIKIMKKFRVEYEGPEIGTIVRMSLIPDKPLNLKFIER